MRGDRGLSISDRTYRGKIYRRCFVGTEAVEWLMRTCGVPLGTAEALGQRLLELGIFHHVMDTHDFVGENYFYRMRTDEVTLTAG